MTTPPATAAIPGTACCSCAGTPRVILISDEVLAKVGGYLLGNFITSAIAGLGTYLWMLALGIPYPILLGMFVALADLIPVIGSTVGGAVVTLVALTVSLPVALATLAVEPQRPKRLTLAVGTVQRSPSLRSVRQSGPPGLAFDVEKGADLPGVPAGDQTPKNPEAAPAQEIGDGVGLALPGAGPEERAGRAGETPAVSMAIGARGLRYGQETGAGLKEKRTHT